jgi:hypothetical protein
VDEKTPSIFSADEWPSAKPSDDITPRSRLASPASADGPALGAPQETRTIRHASEVFPATPERSEGSDAPAQRSARLPPVTPDATSSRPEVASAAAAAGSLMQPARHVLRALLMRLDRLPAIAAAALGFGVLSAIAAAALLWPASRSTADARGVAFQDQRRWQDGQVQKPVVVPVVVKATAPVDAAVPAIKSAAAPPPAIAPTVAVPTVCGGVEPKTTPLAAGMMSLAFRSSCHRQQALTLSYGGLEFKRRFDVDGGLDVTIDCIFGASVPVNVTFADGKGLSVQTSCLDLDRVSKIAVVWRQPVDLDLQVFEKPAAPGVVGQISRVHPGVRDTARALSSTERAARGFLSSIGSAKSHDGSDGVRMTVYTAFHPPQATTQTIPVAIDFATRGETAAGDTCIGGRLADPTYEVVRLTARGQVTREDGQFAALTCGTVVAPPLRFNQSLHAPMRIRN